MDDEEALLRAIALDAEDITLRLVYADWLEEHGQTSPAAFIRHQCGLDGFLTHPPGRMDYFDPRYRRLEEIHPALAPFLLEPFQPFFDEVGLDPSEQVSPYGPFRVRVRRGLVEEVTLIGRWFLFRFLPHLPGVLSRLPIRSFGVLSQGVDGPEKGFSAPHLTNLVTCEGMSRLERLDLSGLSLSQNTLHTLGRKLAPVPWKALRLNGIGIIPGLRQRLIERIPQVEFYDPDDIPF